VLDKQVTQASEQRTLLTLRTSCNLKYNSSTQPYLITLK
jgi:hypothetical protein